MAGSTGKNIEREDIAAHEQKIDSDSKEVKKSALEIPETLLPKNVNGSSQREKHIRNIINAERKATEPMTRIHDLRNQFLADSMAEFERLKIRKEKRQRRLLNRCPPDSCADLTRFQRSSAFALFMPPTAARRLTAFQKCGTGPMAILVYVSITWLCAATLFYVQHNDWSITTSFYYSIQAGMAVGFGAISEPDDGSRLFTIFHVLVGSSFIVYVLSMIMEKVVNSSQSWHEGLQERCEKAEELLKMKKRRERISWISCNHLKMIAIFMLFLVTVLLGVGWGLMMENFEFVQALHFSVAALSTAGLQPPTIDPHKEDIMVFLLSIWMLFGIPFYGFILFAVAARFTKSNTSRKTRERMRKQARTEKFHAAAAIAKKFRSRDSADVMKNIPTDKEISMIINSRLRKKLRNLKKAVSMDNTEIDWAGFLQMTLMRLGKIDAEFLWDARKHFEIIDFDGSGKLDQFEMWAALKFEQFDVDNSGTLDIEEFVAMASSLGFFSQKGANPVALRQAFLRVNSSQTGSITRREFVLWMRKQWKRKGMAPIQNSNPDFFFSVGVINRAAEGDTSLLDVSGFESSQSTDKTADTHTSSRNKLSYKNLSRSQRSNSSGLGIKGDTKRKVSFMITPSSTSVLRPLGSLRTGHSSRATRMQRKSSPKLGQRNLAHIKSAMPPRAGASASKSMSTPLSKSCFAAGQQHHLQRQAFPPTSQSKIQAKSNMPPKKPERHWVLSPGMQEDSMGVPGSPTHSIGSPKSCSGVSSEMHSMPSSPTEYDSPIARGILKNSSSKSPSLTFQCSKN
eukprot:CAMPEP_0184495896 /NCGR_PEP_ID=MMETSP0113_2-20130426/32593_1 /TAXON_ID=91329 /ORGANISM="Norrisiella sphaerica, Strain BC52" /LENGTH=794 /DNA_ID=CAMNT_0026882289 /DNA_START=92 /DNA_END=2476 /DNA_ORIENTATION=-